MKVVQINDNTQVVKVVQINDNTQLSTQFKKMKTRDSLTSNHFGSLLTFTFITQCLNASRGGEKLNLDSL